MVGGTNANACLHEYQNPIACEFQEKNLGFLNRLFAELGKELLVLLDLILELLRGIVEMTFATNELHEILIERIE